MNSTLLAELRRRGAVIASDASGAGVESFGDPAREAAAAVTGCVIVEQSRLGRLVLRGKDHRDLLHRISTNDIQALKPGEGCLTALLNPRGRIIDLLQVLAGEEQLLLLTSAGNGGRIRELIDSFIFREDVAVEEAPSDGLIGLFGPGAANILETLTGLTKLEALPAAWHLEARANSVPLRVIRTFPMAGSGFLVLLSSDSEADFWNALAQAGAVPAGAQALERLRVAAGVPALGHELTGEHNPWEAGLDQAISLTKGCYTGQEIVARLHTYKKVQRKLAGLSLEGDGPPDAGSLVYQGGRSLGQVTSSAASPVDGKTIALAILALPHPVPGETLEVESGGTRRSAKIRALPFPG